MIEGVVSIRPSPKGEGNHASTLSSMRPSSSFQSALHPKVKGIVMQLGIPQENIEFQSALHPKVKGINGGKDGIIDIMRFQSALHPKVKGIPGTVITPAGFPPVSIRPSPKGEGNLMRLRIGYYLQTVSIRPSPKGEGNQVFSIFQICQGCCFNPPFTQR